MVTSPSPSVLTSDRAPAAPPAVSASAVVPPALPPSALPPAAAPALVEPAPPTSDELASPAPAPPVVLVPSTLVLGVASVVQANTPTIPPRVSTSILSGAG